MKNLDAAFALYEKLRPFLRVYWRGGWHWMWRPNMAEGPTDMFGIAFSVEVKIPTFELFLQYLNESQA